VDAKITLTTLAAVILLLFPFITVAYGYFSIEGPVWVSEVKTTPIPPKPEEGRIIIVSQTGDGDFTSISEAVSYAEPGDKIIIMPGIYRESVIVDRKPWITIEGTDTDTVILEGNMKRGNGIYVVFSPHVRIANLTVRNYMGNGIFYVSSDYFEVVRVKAINNRVYGVNFLASEKGVVSRVIASGSGDSGIYVGEVKENCECIIEYSEAYNNSLGYSGTRANGVIIRYSYFHDNAIGIAPNTLLPNIRMFLLGKWPLEIWASNNIIEHNIIENNNNRNIKAAGFAASYGVPVGVGIAMIGSPFNIVRNNTIKGNMKWGIAEWYFLVPPMGNTYISNVFEGNGVDYWRDGWGFLGCSSGEEAVGDVPPPCNIVSFLRLTFPNPIKHIELLLDLEVPGYAALVLFIVGGVIISSASNKRVRENIVSRRKHILSSFIDALLVGDLYLLMASLLIILGFGILDFRGIVDGVVSLTLLLLPLAYFIWAVLFIVYGLITEVLMGATLGKKLLKINVTRYGYKPGKARLVIRNIAKVFDLLLFGLVGVLSILLTKKSIGDIIAGTSLEEVKR